MPQQKKSRKSAAGARPEADLLGTRQAAAELGVSQATLRRWVQEGRVEALRVGKKWRFSRDKLRALVTVQTARTASSEEPADMRLLRETEAELDALLRIRGLAADAEDASSGPFAGKAPPRTAAGWSILQKVLAIAVDARASDVHFEPEPNAVRVRQRLDGILADMVHLPRPVYAEVVGAVMRACRLGDAEPVRPLDGRVIMRLLGREIDFRLNIFPGVHGPSLTLRLLDAAVVLLTLDRLGLDADDAVRWRRIIRGRNGLVVVTGPTGCGRTTVVYASLAELRAPGVKIVTAEDPVEYMLDGVTQAEIKPRLGFGFEQAVTAMLRQATNIMFVGEIRSVDVGEMLCRAALTGHTVFTTMHTNDAPSVPVRLIEMGVDPHLVANSLAGVLAVRLVRLICRHCRTAYQPTSEQLDAAGIEGAARDCSFYVGKGCDRCRNTGYRGRSLVAQLLEVEGKVREAILRDNVEAVRETARANGMKLLREAAMEKAVRGETTLEEIIRQVAARTSAL